jgi:uncharacterized protein YeaO (DUF488 family)
VKASTARQVRAKRVYETPKNEDGTRVLATRYWPRGISKESVDEYLPVLAPSRQLLHFYRQGQLDWPRFRNQYLMEMRAEAPRVQIHRLAKVARSEVVTVMCVCADADRCHRSLLRELITRFDEG